jgi:hypothetical protein
VRPDAPCVAEGAREEGLHGHPELGGDVWNNSWIVGNKIRSKKNIFKYDTLLGVD